MTWITVARASDIGIGQSRAVRAGEEKLLVYHLEDGFYATQSRCTHLFRSLESGKIIDGCRIQCPLHRAQFDIRTGEVHAWACFPPGVQLLNAVRGEKALKTYATRVEDGQLQVQLA
jgi:3-phenylpropionate/trans-cinnamate dioxygenase ferredoxin subunit